MATQSIYYNGRYIPLSQYYTEKAAEDASTKAAADSRAREDAQAHTAALEASRYDVSAAQQDRIAANGSLEIAKSMGALSPTGAEQGPNGTTVAYGGAGTGGGSGSRSSSAGGGATDKITDAELARLRATMGMGDAGHVQRTSGDIATQEQQSRDLAFSQAKARAGDIARSSLNSLRGELATRGMGGGEYEASRIGSIGNDTEDSLLNFTSKQFQDQQAQASKNADTQYAGDITQRGQDQQSLSVLMDLIAQRGGLALY